MDNRTELAFEFAREIATQLLTLSTGFLALTVTFTKDLVKSSHGRAMLYLAWILQLGSIAAGVWTLMSLTGALARPSSGTPIFDASVRLPAGSQVLLFFCSMAATVWYGFVAFSATKADGERSPASLPTE
jgi:hypothetical protein